MRVLFTSHSFTGHLRPLLPYIREISTRGHETLVAAPKGARQLLRAEGIAHAPFSRPSGSRLLPIPNAGAFCKAALPQLHAIVREWRPDLIVRESMEFAGVIAAEVARIPHARIEVTNGEREERYQAEVADMIAERRLEAGLPPDNGAALRTAPAFTSFPLALDGDVHRKRAPMRVKLPADVPDPNLPLPRWAVPEGEPLLYISVGTNRYDMEARLLLDIVRAVANLPARALMTVSGFESDDLGPVPGNLTVENWVPQREIMPRITAVLCHGGSGTLLASLRAARPLAIAPIFLAGHLNNAHRAEAAGAAHVVFRPNPDTLLAGMRQALENPALKAGAERVAAEMDAMPPIAAAVDRLEQIVVGG